MRADDVVVMAHGGGGRRSQELLARHVIPFISNPLLLEMDDAAILPPLAGDLVVTTDSFVIQPLFFPGGDIGSLAVCGTVNDLLMQGGVPHYLTVGLIIEEGLPVADLRRIMASLGSQAERAGVRVAAGDTKVIERRGAPGLFINTAGIGSRRPGWDTHVRNARPGDAVICTGTIGDHGMAVMLAREGLGFQSDLTSDVAALNPLLDAVFQAGLPVRALRDPTRGGVAAAANDIAAASGAGVRLDERALPVRPAVRAACDLLGLDPLVVANEGKALIICPAASAQSILDVLHHEPLGRDAAVIGAITNDHPGQVSLLTLLGGERRVDMPDGEVLPRIC